MRQAGFSTRHSRRIRHIASELTDAAIAQILGERIARHRIQTGLTQAELAERAGIGKHTLERLEAGLASSLSPSSASSDPCRPWRVSRNASPSCRRARSSCSSCAASRGNGSDTRAATPESRLRSVRPSCVGGRPARPRAIAADGRRYRQLMLRNASGVTPTVCTRHISRAPGWRTGGHSMSSGVGPLRSRPACRNPSAGAHAGRGVRRRPPACPPDTRHDLIEPVPITVHGDAISLRAAKAWSRRSRGRPCPARGAMHENRLRPSATQPIHQPPNHEFPFRHLTGPLQVRALVSLPAY